VDGIILWDRIYDYPSAFVSYTKSRIYQGQLLIQNSFSDNHQLQRGRQLLIDKKTGDVIDASIYQSAASLSPWANMIAGDKQLFAGIQGNSINLTQLDQSYETEWSYTYRGPDTTGQNQYPVSLIEANSGFLIAGNIREGNNWMDQFGK